MRTSALVRGLVPVLLLSTLLPHLSTAVAQVLSAPVGAPLPATKSFGPNEPRTPIDAVHTPGDAGNLYIISAPGSYYLPGNLTGVSGKNGIEINADNVTVDLDGFAVVGVAGTLDAISVTAPHRNLRLYNGSIDFWYGHGAFCTSATNSQFDHLRISQNNGIGLMCGEGCVLESCTVDTNGQQGIIAGERCTLTACTSANNGFDGINAADFSTLTNCTSSGNLAPYSGFNVGLDCTLTACCARGDYNGFKLFGRCTIKDCTANLNGRDGIDSSSDTVIVNCSTCNNALDGISCTTNCLVSGNTANFNFNGIESTGLLNRIDGNVANRNSHVGILWLNDYVVRNTAFLNTTANYSPAIGVGNTGPLNAASSSTSPWANF